MTFLVVLAAAVGVVLFLSGLPILKPPRLEERADPYIRALTRRPGRLIDPPSTGTMLTRWVGRYRPMSYARLAERLEAAGAEFSVEAFRLQQVVWAAASVGALAAVTSLAVSSGVVVDLRALGPLTILIATLGVLGRDRYLSIQIAKRRSALADELPVAMDLLTLAIMSGESIPAACARLSEAMRSGVGAEFATTVADMRAGATAVEALEGLGRRIADPAAARLVDSLCTALERGAPLADVLRAQADDIREARRRRLLEAGGRREIYMLIPVVFLIMPVVVLFALLPGLATLDLLVP